MSKKRPSMAEALETGTPKAPRRWEPTTEQLADVEECRTLHASGKTEITLTAVARALKIRYEIPLSVDTIRRRLSDIVGARW